MTCVGNLGLGFVDLVELDEVANGVGVTLFKAVEALRGAFFFSTSVELKEELPVKWYKVVAKRFVLPRL